MTFAFPSADSERGSSLSPRKRAGWTLLTLLASLVLVVASVGLVGTRQVFERLGDVDTRWLGAAFAVGFVQVGLLGLRWSKISRELDMKLSWLRATTEYALSLLGNQVLPTGVAGDGLRGVRQAQSSAQGYGPSFEALALDRASGQLGLWLIVLASAPLSVHAGILSASTLGWALLGVLGSALALWYVTFRVQLLAPRLGRVRPVVARAANLLFSRRAAIHLPLSLLLVGTSTLQLYIAGRALGVHLPWLELAWLAPLMLVASSVPSFFGGWGIREGACALLFAAAGLPESAGVAVSVVYGVFALVISLPAVVVLLFDANSAAPGSESPWTYANSASMIAGSLLAAAVGYPPLLGFVAGFCCFILVARGQGTWTPRGRFGIPNLITTARLLMTMALLFAYGRNPGWHLAVVAALVLLLDAVDGWVARRTGQSSAFGASYDVEADALLVMTIAMLLYTRGVAGIWVLLAGLLRYLYVLAPALIPTPVGQAPRSRFGRIVYVTMLTCYMLALVVEGELGWLVALVGTSVVTLSFSHSFYQRYASTGGA
jgi:phosphatidylglycerophosphate synthase/uncharacterized membrane protein YbhN (UPF0104 family)